MRRLILLAAAVGGGWATLTAACRMAPELTACGSLPVEPAVGLVAPAAALAGALAATLIVGLLLPRW